MIATTPAPRQAVPTGAQAATPIVSVRGLTKSFAPRRTWRDLLTRPWHRPEPVTVVDHVSFDVNTAEFFGLLGANGAGKTTLFRMLGTQLLPDGGTAQIDGRDIVRESRAVRELLTPVVADERSLNWRLTASENLDLFATLYGIPREQRRARVRELLERVELHEAGSKMVGTFSSGMKQRLLIARALLPNPRVLLLDEPTRSLDAVSARRFRQFLRDEIVGRQRCTVLLATHNAEEAFELCDRVAVLDRGHVLAVGRMDELIGQVHDDSYRIAVRSAHESAALRTLAEHRAHAVGPAEAEGWTLVELRIEGGPDGAAAVLARLAGARVDVSALERRAMTLADLLERMIARGQGTHA